MANPNPIPSDTEDLIPTEEFRRLLGGVSEMTIYNWERKYSDFPRPYQFGGPGAPRFWVRGEALAWREKHRLPPPKPRPGAMRRTRTADSAT